MEKAHTNPQTRQESFQLNHPLDNHRPYNVPISSSGNPGETPVFRNVKVKDDLSVVPEDGIRTVKDLIRRSADKFGSNPAFGSRTEIQAHLKDGPPDANGNKKQLTISELSPYEFISYIEYEKLVTAIGLGLVSLGLTPSQDKICMWAQTSASWLSTFHGAASQSIAIVTAYSNLGLSGLQHALESTDSVAIFVDSSSIARLALTLDAVPALRLVVYKNDTRISGDVIQKFKQDFSKVKFIEFDELVSLGRSAPAISEPHSPSPDDICAIMYTSGSTGNPKGVPLRHKNIVAAVSGWNITWGGHFDSNDVVLAYLPLAHIMEFISEHGFLYWGVPMGYGTPRTLFDHSVQNCKGDLTELRPTYMVGVPAIWESARKSIVASIGAYPPDKQTAFWDALRDKQRNFEEGVVFPSEREAAFSGVRGIFGGRLRFMMTGGSGIAKHTQEFISFSLAPITGGFGMTETCGTGAMMDPTQWHTGSLGGLSGCVEAKLIDHEEAGYHASSNPPEGELCIRGASVVDSYWRNEDETSKAFTVDGWLKTGDIGRFDEHGALWIIDRKKNLVKNVNGQYIALEKLEALYRSAPVVANVCIYADSTRVKPTAIIIPIEPVLNKLLQSTSGTESSASETAQAQRVVLQQLHEKAREYDLPSLEVVEAVVISPLKEWDVTNGMTTAVGKLKRRAILEYHQESIDEVRK
ncbi:hypothetical protein HYFRA_00010298 [Hymenoscyphus fraxineus]|uniref:AMP-dependent synthetase/ligase domain-containing protein n=1 Tax=Hymenoscyphus fraxineus TaxID=746836 RepID=A0A9N9PUB0_9HELO|nr:hypothetical protein HYFRA_00010298 [Hymenoscyphus fraxineus]